MTQARTGSSVVVGNTKVVRAPIYFTSQDIRCVERAVCVPVYRVYTFFSFVDEVAWEGKGV